MKRKPECSKCAGTRDTKMAYCSKYNKEYQRTHYLKNKKVYNKRAKDYKDANRRRLYEYLKGRCCTDCGETRIPALQFDHVRGEKRGDVSQMVSDRCRWKVILQEISKCEIRCANCHAVKTAITHNWHNF